MTDQQILAVLMGLKGAKEGEGGYTMIEFARAILAAAPVAAPVAAQSERIAELEDALRRTIERTAAFHAQMPRATVQPESKPITIKELVHSVKAGEKWKVDESAPVAAQEPVAYFWRDKAEGTVGLRFTMPEWVDDPDKQRYELVPLYAATSKQSTPNGE